MDLNALLKMDRTALYDRRNYVKLHLIGALYWKNRYQNFRDPIYRRGEIKVLKQKMETYRNDMVRWVIERNALRLKDLERLVQTCQYWIEEIERLDDEEYLNTRIAEETEKWRSLHEEGLIIHALLSC